MRFIYALILLLVSTSLTNEVFPIKQGCLLLVGGGNIDESLKNQFIKLSGGDNSRLILIPCASGDPETPSWLRNDWSKYPHKSIEVVENPEDLYKIKNATGVWMCGGCQVRLIEKLPGLKETLRYFYKSGGTIGGTSAGASVVGSYMPYQGTYYTGLGIISNLIIDQHFSQRERFTRLKNIVVTQPDCIGIGIDEETAILLNDYYIDVLGINSVTIISKSSSNDLTYQVYHSGDRISR